MISSEVIETDFLKQIEPLIEKFELNLVVILVYRDAIERAASSYNQEVKDPVVGLNMEPDSYLLERLQGFKMQGRFERWKSVVQEVHVIPYRAERSLLERFCVLINITVNDDEPSKIYNKSMGGHALLTILIANKLFDEENKRREFFEYLRTIKDFKIWQGPSFPFSEDAQTAARVLLEDEYKWAMEMFQTDQGFSVDGNLHSQFKLPAEQIDKIKKVFKDKGLYDEHVDLIDYFLEKFI